MIRLAVFINITCSNMACNVNNSDSLQQPALTEVHFKLNENFKVQQPISIHRSYSHMLQPSTACAAVALLVFRI